MVTKVPAFWDTSALVPLCVREPETEQVRLHLRRFTQIVWWASAVEVRSAVARLRRDAPVETFIVDQALAHLDVLRQGWQEILPDSDLRELACSLLDAYSLRASDSLQLAAALTWCQRRPRNRIFISFDRRLNDAAKAAGFSLPETSTSRR